MQRPRSAVAGIALLSALAASGSADAGHGLINSFAGIEWLPDPGVTPDATIYPLELAQEAAVLRLTRAPAARLELLRAQARERLAELDAMVRVGLPTAAQRATDGYATALRAMRQLIESAANPARDRAWAEELLAHQYMLSTNYLDLPRDSRQAIAPMMTLARDDYARLSTRLPQRTKDALFFKEEEVRWSWEMAVAADEQGL
jgi:hypothetical protein